ncbi:MAG: hypothetical protein ACP5Q4_10055, partial [Candidatus Caldatribacteriaceae bacterium]
MRKRISWGVLLFLVVVIFAGCSTGGNDKELIQKTLEGYFAALNVPDEAKAYEYVLPESAAAGWLDMFFAEKVPFAAEQGVKYEYTFTIQEITISAGGGEAAVKLTYTFRLLGSQGGLSAPKFEETFSLSRQGRTWRISV